MYQQKVLLLQEKFHIVLQVKCRNYNLIFLFTESDHYLSLFVKKIGTDNLRIYENVSSCIGFFSLFVHHE